MKAPGQVCCEVMGEEGPKVIQYSDGDSIANLCMEIVDGKADLTDSRAVEIPSKPVRAGSKFGGRI